jgi:hypothetical protein
VGLWPLQQLGIPAGLKDVAAISAGWYHVMALKRDGTVVAWGSNLSGETDVPAGLKGVTAIAAGAAPSLALKSDGTVVAWGSSFLGPNTVPPGLTGVTAIAAGSLHSLAANTLAPYTFSGFLAPVNNPNAVNMGKAGRTYPLKWQLTDKNGKFVTALDAVQSVKFKAAQCGSFTSTLTDGLKAENPGKTQLTYDAASQQYHYNWASPSAPGCYTLLLTLNTGQVHQAYFNLSDSSQEHPGHKGPGNDDREAKKPNPGHPAR